MLHRQSHGQCQTFPSALFVRPLHLNVNYVLTVSSRNNLGKNLLHETKWFIFSDSVLRGGNYMYKLRTQNISVVSGRNYRGIRIIQVRQITVQSKESQGKSSSPTCEVKPALIKIMR